jgi:hypothetical protein
MGRGFKTKLKRRQKEGGNGGGDWAAARKKEGIKKHFYIFFPAPFLGYGKW